MTKKLNLEVCRDFLAHELFTPKSSKGDTSKGIDLIGVELEAFPVKFLDFKKTKATPVPLKSDKFSLHQVLEKASALEGGQFDFNEKNSLLPIRFPNGSTFQYEPGGQIEIATHPCKSLDELVAQLRFQQNILNQITEEYQIHFAQIGTNPWFDSAQIGLQLDKARYRALQKYFASLGPFGVKMMRQTCSLHVNLDLGDSEEMQVKRILAANLLAPFASAIFANSAILENKISPGKSYRSYLWQQLDPNRTGIQLGDFGGSLPTKDQLIQAYFDFAMKSPIIHIMALGDRVFPSEITFKDWLKIPIEGISPSLEDLENHLSLLYPEVRPKGFLEIRTADALPREWQLVPAFFYTGILYSEEMLGKTLELLRPLRSEINTLWKEASFGFDSKPILELSIKLMELALAGLNALPDNFSGKESQNNLQAFFEKFTLRGKTVADESVFKFFEGKSLID